MFDYEESFDVFFENHSSLREHILCRKSHILTENISKYRIKIEKIEFTEEEKKILQTWSNILDEFKLFTKSITKNYPYSISYQFKNDVKYLFERPNILKYFTFVKCDTDNNISSRIRDIHKKSIRDISKIKDKTEYCISRKTQTNIGIVYSSEPDILIDVRLAYPEIKISKSFELNL